MQRTPAYILTRKILEALSSAGGNSNRLPLHDAPKYKLQPSTTRSPAYNQMMSRVFGYVYRTVYLSLLASRQQFLHSHSFLFVATLHIVIQAQFPRWLVGWLCI